MPNAFSCPFPDIFLFSEKQAGHDVFLSERTIETLNNPNKINGLCFIP